MDVLHRIILPNNKEDIDTLREIFAALLKLPYPMMQVASELRSQCRSLECTADLSLC
jgi:hypothetical protein